MIDSSVPEVPSPSGAPTITTSPYSITLITPLYGGGVKAGVNDQEFPVRPTSIRGQLRFWWRATRGARFETVEQLFKEEEKIWGSTDNPSATKVIVADVKINSKGPRRHDFWDGNSMTRNGRRKIMPFEFDPYGNRAYALFSAKNNKHDLVREGLSFKLKITYEKANEKDVECAIWAWVNFGGIGSRTRRGCGALYCEEFAPKVLDKKWWLETLHNKYGFSEQNFDNIRENPRPWTSLFGNFFGVSQFCYNDALAAWDKAIEPMKNFRQKDGFAREPKRGLSRWPEPDTIRRWQCTASTGHETRRRNLPDGFPRAAFGLPIIIKFIDDEDNKKRAAPYDPDESQISPYDPGCQKNFDRMSSPFILRPLALRDGKTFRSAVILLQTLPLKGIKIKATKGTRKGQEKVYNNDYIISDKFASYPGSPISSTPEGDAVKAFLAYAKKQGFQEI
jgi:CRISPR-associated protein Cmr1